MPLLTSATGRCFAAFMGAEGRDAQGVAPMIREELARTRKLPQSGANLTDIPLTQQDVQTMLQTTRKHGLGRVVNSLLPGVGGFCAPVFDAQGRLALGLVVLGSVSTLDTDWDGKPARALLHCAQQLSAELGYKPERSAP
jgi:DNA-binding IclR family transcriptional regulator